MFPSHIDSELLPMVRLAQATKKASPLKGETKIEYKTGAISVTRGLLDTAMDRETEIFKKRLEWVAKNEAFMAVHPKPVCLVDGPHCDKCKDILEEYHSLDAKIRNLSLTSIQLHLRLAQEHMRELGTEMTVQFIPGPSMSAIDKKIEASLTYNRTHKRLFQGRPLKICAFCAAVDAVVPCSGCCFVFYCNTKCQTANWELHKQVCKTVQAKSCVECCECRKPRNVWNSKIGIWTTALDDKQSVKDFKFLCGKCREKVNLGKLDPKKMYPRKLWPVCKSGVTADNIGELIRQHSSPTEKLHVVDL